MKPCRFESKFCSFVVIASVLFCCWCNAAVVVCCGDILAVVVLVQALPIPHRLQSRPTAITTNNFEGWLKHPFWNTQTPVFNKHPVSQRVFVDIWKRVFWNRVFLKPGVSETGCFQYLWMGVMTNWVQVFVIHETWCLCAWKPVFLEIENGFFRRG